jgi:hypothetical protein
MPKYIDVLEQNIVFLILLYGSRKDYERRITGFTHWTLVEKLPTVQPLKNFPAFYGTRKFIPHSQEL